MTNLRFSSALLFLPLALLSTGCGNPADEKAAAPNPWSGHTYLLDITAANWSEPRGIGNEIDEFVPNFLMRIDGEKQDEISVMMGTADADGAQDHCNPTGTLGATAEDPSVTIGPSEFPLHIQHTTKPIAVDATAYGMTIKNVLPAGGVVAQDGEFSATMDFRELYELFTVLIDPTPDSVCASFQDAYGFPCEPCPTDGEPYCLTLKAVDLGATEADAVIETVDPADVDPVACTPAP